MLNARIRYEIWALELGFGSLQIFIATHLIINASQTTMIYIHMSYWYIKTSHLTLYVGHKVNATYSWLLKQP